MIIFLIETLALANIGHMNTFTTEFDLCSKISLVVSPTETVLSKP